MISSVKTLRPSRGPLKLYVIPGNIWSNFFPLTLVSWSDVKF